MKRLSKTLKLILLLALALPALPTHAQDGAPGIPPERMKEIKAQKSAFITQRLSLTPEESRTFWPVYDRYQGEMEAARADRRTDRKDLRSNGPLTEEQASKAIAEALQAKQDQLDIRKRYVEEFKKSIGAVKTLKLEGAERDFNKELLKRIRARNAGSGGQR